MFVYIASKDKMLQMGSTVFERTDAAPGNHASLL